MANAGGATTGATLWITRLSVSSAFEDRLHRRCQRPSPPALSEKFAGLRGARPSSPSRATQPSAPLFRSQRARPRTGTSAAARSCSACSAREGPRAHAPEPKRGVGLGGRRARDRPGRRHAGDKPARRGQLRVRHSSHGFTCAKRKPNPAPSRVCLTRSRNRDAF